jgi:hypothetical protein
VSAEVFVVALVVVVFVFVPFFVVTFAFSWLSGSLVYEYSKLRSAGWPDSTDRTQLFD